MATGGTAQATDRDTVLGWMTRTGNGAKAAADHFGLPFERVKKWAQRAGMKARHSVRPAESAAKRAAAPVVVPPMVQEVPAECDDVPRDGEAGDEGVSLGASLPVSPPGAEGSRARATATDAGKPEKAPKPPPKPPAPRLSAANLTAEARERLRTAVLQQLDFLSRADTVDDQKGRADAARALQTLLLTTPDILTFDERTAETGRKSEDLTAKLAAAFGIEAAPAESAG